MLRLLLSAVVLLLVALPEGASAAGPKPKKVKCQNKNYPYCYHKDLYCPDTCARDCLVDCSSCQAVCPPSPPIPPPKVSKVKCKDKDYKKTCTKDLLCPDSCPSTCVADCPNCKAICPALPPTPSYRPPPPPVVTPSPPPPPVVTPSPPPVIAGGGRVRCKNKNFPDCYFREHQCPPACPETCQVDCTICSPVCDCNRPGAVCQDPRFIGADGITFYFHGKKDKDFWVQSLGILFGNHQIFVGAKKTATWDNAVDRLEVSYDEVPVFLAEGEGAKWQPKSAPGVSITRSSDTNAVIIEVEDNFQIKAAVVPITKKDSMIHKYGVTDEDCFAHLDLGFKFYSLSGEVNGVLGQTYASNYVSRAKMGVEMPVLGGQREFASSNLFSTDCAVARFNGTQQSSSNSFQYANLNCASGLDGRGVVCRR